MASRPAWTILNNKIQKEFFEFEWNGGFALSQKRKNIFNLHQAIKQKKQQPALEISTKSEEELGQKLSAFHLKLDNIYLENIFQSSKVYENGGPYLDLLSAQPKEAKRDSRHKTSGKLVCFQYKNIVWELIPSTAFYDYLYIKAAFCSIPENNLKEIINYNWFTDIEFNPKKSINCQARAAAILKYILLYQKKEVLESKEKWILFHKNINIEA